MGFFSSGAGNGFPFCVEKVDVSGFDKAISLGGTQKGNAPTPAELALSWQNAWLLYWKTFGINAKVSFNGDPYITDTADVQSALVNGFADPFDRIGPVSAGVEKYGSSAYAGTGAPSASTNSGLELSFNLFNDTAGENFGQIVAMHNGAFVSSTFMGYGIRSVPRGGYFFQSNPPGIYYVNPTSSVGEGFIYVCSYGDNESAGGSFEDWDVDYTTITTSARDIPVLGIVYALGDNPIADAQNLQSTYELSGTTQTTTISLNPSGTPAVQFWA